MTPPRAWTGAARLLSLGAALALAACSAFTGCSTNVNLGGPGDAGPLDATPGIDEFGDLCEPCVTSQTCPLAATCVEIGGSNTFCATSCPRGTECDADDTCQLVSIGNGGERVRACVPKSGSCAPAKPPASESAPLQRCGALEGPDFVAHCTSCDKDDTFCQANGCYGGWWCNTTTNRCQKPPASCPS